METLLIILLCVIIVATVIAIYIVLVKSQLHNIIVGACECENANDYHNIDGDEDDEIDEITIDNLITGGGVPRVKANKTKRPAKEVAVNDITIKDLKKHPRTASEKSIIDVFEKITGAKFPTVTAKWLTYNGRELELDGYNDALRIAVEFSGPLHTKWYPTKENYESYFARIKKDKIKKEKCHEKNINLITVDMNILKLNSGLKYNYVKSRLYDVGFLDEHPGANIYIPNQVVEPYRNEELERELGLVY